MNWIEPQRNKIKGHFVKVIFDVKVNEISDDLRTPKDLADFNQDQQSRILKTGMIGIAISNEELIFFRISNDQINFYVRRLEKEEKSITLSEMEVINLIRTTDQGNKMKVKVSQKLYSNIKMLA